MSYVAGYLWWSRSLRNIVEGSDVLPDERGWALVSVLWVVTGLSLLAASVELLSANTFRLERETLHHAQAEAALDAGLARAVLALGAPDLPDRWRTDGTPYSFQFGDVTLSIAIQDELGRFDLNAVDGSILVSLLLSQGCSPDDAEKLSDSILDWRSSNADSGLHGLHGATDADYEAAGLSYRPRHAAFQSVDELRLVLGMSPELYDKIRPALTVYTKKPMVDPSVATREALLALYGGNTTQVDDILRARTDLSASGQQLGDTSLSLAGRAFSISVETEIDNRRYRRAAVVMLTADKDHPYLVLSWQ
jgi:general secretion pathway protein K